MSQGHCACSTGSAARRLRCLALFGSLIAGFCLPSPTASARPTSRIAARPKFAAKLGRPTPIFLGSSAAARTALPGNSGKPTAAATARPGAKSASLSGKPVVAPTNKPVALRIVPSGASKSVFPTERNATKPKTALPSEPADNETPAPASDDPNRERILSLQETLTRIVHGSVLRRLRVGMRVLDLATGQLLFSQRGSVLMDPASNQKVLATATALLRLGSTWRFRTELSGPQPDCNGAIEGDLILRGTGDPSLRAAHLDEMAEDLVRRGVSRVDGRVLGDARRIGSDEVAVGRSPLHVGWSAIEVRVRPGDKVGVPALASLRPSSDALRLVNQATTGKGRNHVGVSVSRAGDHIQVLVTGKIGLGRHGVVVWRAPPGDTLYAAILMRTALVQAGIEVRGPAGVYAGEGHEHTAGSAAGLQIAFAGQLGDTPAALVHAKTTASPTILAVHESVPLPLLIRRVNKNSDNEWAERVLEAAGAETFGGSPSTAKGVRALREALTEMGVPAAGYNPANGSGLGHQNRVTPATMADLLRKLYFDPRVGPDLLQSLSVGGVDGTTRNRFRGSSAAERVRAKTGTLNGVSCLSGYVGDKADVLAFSIMVEGHRHRAIGSVRSAQVSAVNAMMRFARGTLGPSPAEEALPGQDLETGGEAAELEGESELPDGPASPGAKSSESVEQTSKDLGKPSDEP